MPDMPSTAAFLYPLLKGMADGESHAVKDLRSLVADDMGLTEEQRRAVHAKTRNSVLGARVSWAQTDLLHAELTERVSSGVYRITQAGRQFLEQHADGFDFTDIETLDPYVLWKAGWGKGGPLLSEEKLAEFEALYAEFLEGFPVSEEGRTIAAMYSSSRVTGKSNYEKALSAPRPSPEFVDAVMWGLMPYRGTPNQREQGAWVHWAPSTIGGTYRAFYGKWWSSEDDWNRVAETLLTFVQGCVDDPGQLGVLADSFSSSPYAKGLQQGMVTPALGALRSDDFYLGNSKTIGTVNHFAGTKHTSSLTSYRAFNETIHKLVDELTPVLEAGPDSVPLLQDRFDMFCHWLVAVRHFFDETGPVPPPPPPGYTLTRMADETGFPEAELQAWVSALKRKKQAILYGPPGTGKTYVARRLAQYLVASDEAGDGFMELVQFHPAYAYEDFIQGIRPQADEDGNLSYELERGRFLDFVDKARERGGTCVLIVDEINRANLARVFGELMYLLEYRDDEIALASGGTLRIPANVCLIGTMNTADRSIALVDHALRRRFAFLELQPQYAVLTKFHGEHATGFPIEALLAVLAKVNRQIGNPHYFVGISFFLDDELGSTIESVWRTEIFPYLDEYFFDQPKVTEQFTWEAVRPQLGL